MVGALTVVAVVVSAEPAFVETAPGLILLAAVAVHRRQCCQGRRDARRRCRRQPAEEQ
ncbi:MAG: hypothetical protein HOV83_11255 [Catenulispora sp.]|nr:hypothetical protein [Catenulispora sp.]